MADQALPMQRWIDAAKQALTDVSSNSLGSDTTMGETNAQPEPGFCGSLVSLSSGQNMTCVGLSSTPAGCRRLAGAMLGMDATESEDISHDDVRDSVGEIVNILAGVLKTMLAGEDPGLTLGLPLFIDGVYEGDRRTQSQYIRCQVGEVPCILTVFVGSSATSLVDSAAA